MAADIKALGDQIVGLTLKEAVELAKYLDETHGIKAAVGGGGGGGGGAVAPVKEAEVEKTDFDVILKSAGDKKIQVIKVVREATGLGLKEAKDLVDGAPKAVKTAIPKADAEALAEKLKKEGAEVELK